MKMYSNSKQSTIFAILIVALAAISRLSLMFFYQSDAGDTATYINFAENIIRGCGFSHSDAFSNDCILTSGGYFPGYPAFIATVWIIFGKSVYAVLIAQLICYLFALMWLLIAIFQLTNSNKIMLAVGVLLALSPLQVGWFRFILTEPLAIATATWFMAELIFSVSNKKLRVFHLALALSASVYVRPDSIFMILAPCLISFYIYDFKKAIQQISLVIILTTIPVSVWLVRNYTIGHAPISMASQATPIAPGYFMWLDTWVVNEYERSDANFPVWRRKYSEIDIHASKYTGINELKKTNVLINDLSLIDGHEFPQNIDLKFKELALEKINNRSEFITIQIYFERIAWLLLNPFSSWGMPLEIKSIDKGEVGNSLRRIDLLKTYELLSENKLVIFCKIASFTYRVMIFATFLYLVIIEIKKIILRQPILISYELMPIIFSVLLVSTTRLIFFVFIGGLESRYLVSIIPWVEASCILYFCYKRYAYRVAH